MKNIFYLVAGIILLLNISQSVSAIERISFDFDWEFCLLPADTSVSSNWRAVDLPHDWSIEGSYSFDNGDWQSGFLPAGIGVYRKDFNFPQLWEGKRMKIHFEGIYMCSTVWINGYELGFRPNGFLAVEYDITPYIKEDNRIEVRVDHSKLYSSRSYSGSGIYRHVWLEAYDEVHIPTGGVFFYTPMVNSTKSAYKVEVDIANLNEYTGSYTIDVILMNKYGQKVSSLDKDVVLPANDTSRIVLDGHVHNVQLWSPDNASLYDLKINIRKGKQVLESYQRKVGFRSIEFSGKRGFILNGEQVKIKGVCERSTAGAVGAAVPDDLLYARIKQLKKMGCNAIRTSHHPFSPGFYEICDSLGVMVMNEIFDGWETPKAKHDYGLYFEQWWERDVTDFVKRDRSHPSVIIWSIGNEVVAPTRETQVRLIEKFRELDPTRLVTQGGHDPTRGMEGEELETLLGVKGFNGDGEEKGVFDKFHALFPDVPVIGTEVPHTLHTRGVYRTKTHWRRFNFPAVWEQESARKVDREKYLSAMFPLPDLTSEEVFPEETSTHYYINGQWIPINNDLPETTYYQSSYDNATVRVSARKAWQYVEENEFMSGQFRWTGFDYLGESFGWPSRFMNCGVIDICGFEKDHYYLYQSLWSDKPMVHMLPHWTHHGKEQVEIPVAIYTNCHEVELFLNGKNLGSKKYSGEQLVWYIPFEPGVLEARAYIDGVMATRGIARTAYDASVIELVPDRTRISANRTDVVQVSIGITDATGTLCPYAENEILFEVSGGAKIIGVDNGDPLDLSDYKTDRRRAFRGRAMLWLQSNGNGEDVRVTARSEGLESSTINIEVR